MRYIFLILSFGILYAQQSAGEWWQDASQAQRDSIRATFDRNKVYDKGWTLAALKPDESSGGLFLVRLAGKEAGDFGQKAYNVAKRANKQKRLQVPFNSLWTYLYEETDNPNEWQIDRAFQRLIQDRQFDDQHARGHIDELLQQYDGDWFKVGGAWNSQKPGQAERVRDWIRFLRTLGWE